MTGMAIRLNKDDVLLVKESLKSEASIMRLSIEEYKNKIKEFEKKHHMKTKTFVKKFNSGELGDDGEWFDWIFVFKAYQHIKDRVNRITSIS